MTISPKQLYRSRSMTNQFMVQTSGYDWTEAGPVESLTSNDAMVVDLIKSRQPGVFVENRFLTDLKEKVTGENKFGVLALCPEFKAEASKEVDDSEKVAIVEGLGAVLNDICLKYDGLWGILGASRLLCILPQINSTDCVAINDEIRKAFNHQFNNSFSTGIAVYPMINFQKSDIIENACKALVHAEYYEDGRAILFDAVSLNISGDAFYQKGEIKKACDEYRQALKIDPLNTNVHNSLGVCYGVFGDFKKALDAFETTAWLDPKEIMAHYNAGLTYMLMDKTDLALDCFLSALEINDDIFEILLKTGLLYIEHNEPEKALTYLEKSTRINPKPGYTYRYLGDCYAKLNDMKAAVNAYKKAVKQNPNDAASFSALGYLFEKMGENKEIALMFCKQSVAIEPENGLFRFRLGYILNELGLYSDALVAFNVAEDLGYDTGDYIHTITEQPIIKAS